MLLPFESAFTSNRDIYIYHSHLQLVDHLPLHLPPCSNYNNSEPALRSFKYFLAEENRHTEQNGFPFQKHHLPRRHARLIPQCIGYVSHSHLIKPERDKPETSKEKSRSKPSIKCCRFRVNSYILGI